MTQNKQMPKLDKPILIISHANCDDGMGAAWASWKKFGNTADYWFAFYGSEPPPVKDKEVYLVDFSYSREALIKMNEEARELKVLDHHETAENILKDLPFCHFDGSKSGAMLAWEYFHSGVPNGILLHHIQDNDLWKFECPRTKAFIMNLRSHPQTIATFNSINDGLENKKSGDEFYKAFVRDGETLLRYFNAQLSLAVKATAQDITLCGIKGRVANLTGMFASEAGNLMAGDYGTFGMTYFVHSTGSIKCSIRSQKGNGCNVADIALTFGGGGHANASGFSLTQEQLIGLLNANK